ncbi:hypothetical protein L211DRAFT_866154 [Terfezia boudieri ATCC MYA-4762]|uniref:Uncharacterized protein n=1 Tax=Terfezia boudieri ATCC MYA-4762 TaxID=1051890 RepID=A0A3N4LYI3_9PEZI|nr:hypothetical protein L211DRAFT_866154 [Terfezia boudieri ATCC MYA-4762]
MTTTPGGTATSLVSSSRGPGPGSTLLSGGYWIRAVAHQTSTCTSKGLPRAVGNAVLNSGSTAGQFNIINGQLIQLISPPGAPERYLYGTVAQRAGTEMTFLLTWQTSPSTYGTFSFSETLQSGVCLRSADLTMPLG